MDVSYTLLEDGRYYNLRSPCGIYGFSSTQCWVEGGNLATWYPMRVATTMYNGLVPQKFTGAPSGWNTWGVGKGNSDGKSIVFDGECLIKNVLKSSIFAMCFWIIFWFYFHSKY